MGDFLRALNGVTRFAKKPSVEKPDIESSTPVPRVRSRGTDVPGAEATFEGMASRFKWPSKLLQNIHERGYAQPTPIQTHAIPVMASGRELLAISPTGSGKTLAFALPLLHSVWDKPADGLKVVVVAPTRELASQIYTHFLMLTQGSDIRLHLLTKASAMATESFDDRHVLIATPMRLVQLIQKRKVNLKSVQHLVFDEGDQLFDGAFLQQIDAILNACRNREIRRYLFSATLLPAVEELARTVLHDPIRLTVGQRNTAVSHVEQKLVYAGTEQGKLIALRNVFRDGITPPVLVFLQSKDRVKQLYEELQFDPFRVSAIHADQTQAEREVEIKKFRLGETWVLLCTELLARGIDFRNVRCVINYDFPQSQISYIHRCGRTGRAGRSGLAITLFTDEDVVLLRTIANLILGAGGDVPEWVLRLKTANRQKRKALATHPPKRKRIAVKLIQEDEQEDADDGVIESDD